jgi:glycerol-3-phosphate dehydrogenase
MAQCRGASTFVGGDCLKENTQTTRSEQFKRLSNIDQWDLAIIGGGATGLGIALDAASRGCSVVLVEGHDFAKGTSSRATKLLHGGVRYLAQGNLSLVYEALSERSVILKNAPHLAQKLPFVIPTYGWWDQLQYGIGLTVYSWLAGHKSLGKTELLGPNKVQQALPTVRTDGLVGGVRYWDAQFDDARLALALARTASQHGAMILNYCMATELLHHSDKVVGLVCEDLETRTQYKVSARCVVNATGVWADGLRRTDMAPKDFAARVQPARGAHLILDRRFLPTNQALMVPKTSDGRVLFAIPWQGKLLAGTTDVPTAEPVHDPEATRDEVDFILSELGEYLKDAPTRSDILSLWAGLRPLVRPDAEKLETKSISREHDIQVSKKGLVTVTGGKWTTYRVIAKHTLQTCIERGLIKASFDCTTADLRLVGATDSVSADLLSRYGSEANLVATMRGAENYLCPDLTEGMVRFAASYEHARTVEDVLARRVRLLFLDAKLALTLARRVAEILKEETGVDPALADFERLAAQYSGSL